MTKRRRTPALDVVTFGEVLWDIYEAKARGAEPIATTFRRELGGALGNVATGLARLGRPAAVVGGIGRDPFGRALAAHLERDGVDTRFLLHLPNPTGITFITRSASGEPTFLFYRHASADLAVGPEHVTAAMGKARWVVVGTSTSIAPRLARATDAFLEAGAKGGAARVVDLNVRAHLWPSPEIMKRTVARLASRAALVKASEADLAALAGRGEGPGLAWLRRHAPGATWIVTRGGGVASAIGLHGRVDVAAKPTRCVDATGAGDAFLAGVLATLTAAGTFPGTPAWRETAPFLAALEVGHAMGRKAVGRVGSVAGLTGLGPLRARLKGLQRRGEP